MQPAAPLRIGVYGYLFPHQFANDFSGRFMSGTGFGPRERPLDSPAPFPLWLNNLFARL
jgi:hypothetical protein